MEAISVKRILISYVIFTFISTVVRTQSPETLQSFCASRETCHECIQVPACAWCLDPTIIRGPRCFDPSIKSNTSCPEELVLNPDNILTIVKNLKLSETRSVVANGTDDQTEPQQRNERVDGEDLADLSGDGRTIVQVTPQKLNLKLRLGMSYSLNISTRQSEDYPLDLYYLMDFSKSMEDDKERLFLLGEVLTETMKNLTSDFKIGFGSFVDKPVMPYVSTVPEHLLEPCEGCAPPYGYRHVMTLSSNTSQFADVVKQAQVSGNLDAPEGGLDALLQTIVCRQQIGWRERARKVIVFSTDAGLHIAGDGKLGGIVKPNDGECHIDHDGIYTKSSSQDYPSIGQLNYVVKDNSVNVIFAVAEQNIELYEEFAKNIEGTSVGKLKVDSSNIVDLIREQYQQISTTIELKNNASSAVSINIFANCLNGTEGFVNSNKCEDVKIGDTVQFRIDIKLTECPKDRKDYSQTIQIYLAGIDESLIIDLEMLCECACENPENKDYVKDTCQPIDVED